MRTPFSKQDEERITKLIFTLFLTQKRYGMSPDDIPAMGKAYSWALRGYEYKDVYEAVTALVRKMPDIPTPADIIKRIDELIEDRRVKSLALPPPLQGWIADMAKEIGDVPARAWFERCEFDGETLKTPDKMTRDWIEEKYTRQIGKVLGEVNIS